MHSEPGKTTGKQPENGGIKADDFDKEKAAADNAVNNTSNNNESSPATAKDEVLKEQKETD